jgi:hypothetical protein
MSKAIRRQIIIITVYFGNKEAAQFHFWKYINGKPDIYIGFSPALHLQCRLNRLSEKIVIGNGGGMDWVLTPDHRAEWR